MSIIQKSSLAVILAVLHTAWGQSNSLIFGGGYAPPVPIVIAPGTLITLFVQSIGTQPTSTITASGLPLPVKLAGFSVALKQVRSPQGPIPVPILAVFTIEACAAQILLGPCGRLTGINVQIPFELIPNTLLGAPVAFNSAHLIVSDEAGNQAIIEAVTDTDNIHILRANDTLRAPGKSYYERPAGLPLVTHTDGKLVTGDNPAQSGEILILYAVGLGLVMPQAKSGEATPLPAPVVEVYTDFTYNFTGESSPHLPLRNEVNRKATLFAGLTPGSVGLYQVNFMVPELPLQFQKRCDTFLSTNLTVSIGGLRSFDGVAICVRVP